MKKIKFYVCPICNNVIISTSEAEVSCCTRKLEGLAAKKSDEFHNINISEIEDEYYLTFSHDMKKDHYISFVAYVTYDKYILVKLYPEGSNELRIPKLHGGKFYFYCTRDGLWVN